MPLVASLIKVQTLSKVYKQYAGRSDHLKEILIGGRRHRQLWALRDVSFEIETGESFGLVGDNGAGKSTLLKILCATTFPTKGRVEVQGSVSALLELGAGFHPEFSGRANIYFSGALMGFDRAAIASREERIIAFSELADFIDQPVKTYSSGMYLRLGFALATGFDPDVLVIDEALAVGDQRFQKKCTDRIMGLQEAGKTILFCSHNLYQVQKLCRRTLWLEDGRVAAIGPSEDVVGRYRDKNRTASGGLRPSTLAEVDQIRGPICRLERFRLADSQGHQRSSFESGDTLQLEVWSSFKAGFEGQPAVGVTIMRRDGVMVYTVSSSMDGKPLGRLNSDLHYIRIVLPSLPLLRGHYSFSVSLTDQHNMQCYDLAEEVEPFAVSHSGEDFGLALLKHEWSDRPLEEPAQTNLVGPDSKLKPQA